MKNEEQELMCAAAGFAYILSIIAAMVAVGVGTGKSEYGAATGAIMLLAAVAFLLRKIHSA